VELLALPLKDPVAVFGSVLLILFLAPMAMEFLRLPGMVGLLLAGARVGPGGFNLLERNGEIALLGSVGLVYIMFLAGVEIDLGMLKKNRGHGTGFGL
jgi:Kef-type K+ transport system membrane component KefB